MLKESKFRTVFLSDKSGYGLTTANVLYHMPAHPSLLQSFVWQFNDIAPDYPRLLKFLDYWRREIDGVIRCVEVAHKELASAAEIRNARFEGRLH